MNTKEVAGKATITLDDSNILTVEMAPKADINADDAVEICEVIAQVSGDVTRCNLVDVSKMTFMDKKARSVFADQKKDTVLAVGVISNSILHRSLLNLYMKFSNPIIPTKAFDSKEQARAWLLEKLK